MWALLNSLRARSPLKGIQDKPASSLVGQRTVRVCATTGGPEGARTGRDSWSQPVLSRPRRLRGARQTWARNLRKTPAAAEDRAQPPHARQNDSRPGAHQAHRAARRIWGLDAAPVTVVRVAWHGQGCSNRESRESRGAKKRRFAPNREALNKIPNRPNRYLMTPAV